MVFCNSGSQDEINNLKKVTILILIDGFLQYFVECAKKHMKGCHNPYFNRWFSAIVNGFFELLTCCIVTILILIDGFLQ